jgi:hypothetical protein
MRVALALLGTLAVSGLLALVVLRALRKNPRWALVAAILGFATAAATVVVLVTAPVIHGMAGTEVWPSTVTTYFLAMGNRLADGPYAFFWTPRWMYVIGSLTPLVALGACLALGAGLAARPVARKTAVVIVAVASFLLVAYVVSGAYAAAGTWDGIPV